MLVEFFVKNQEVINISFEVVIFLFWILNFNVKNVIVNFFFATLFICSLIECLAYIDFVRKNFHYFILNFIYDGLFSSAVLWFYYLILKKTKYIQLIVLISYIGFYTYTFLIKDVFFETSNSEILIAFSICLFLSILLLFYEIFNSKIILYIQCYLPFWISCYLMVTMIATIPIFSLHQQLSDFVFKLALLFLNSTGYILLIIGIIKSKNKKDLYL